MKAGDRVRVVTGKGTVEGVLMPESPDAVFIKLDSGYNVGIDRRNVRSMETLKARAPRKEKSVKVAARKGLPTIAILHTGGTIASKVDYETGAVIARFSPQELLGQFAELFDIANVKSELLSNMWSEDMRFAHYNVMARAVAKAVKAGAAGVMITHGTDTLHYSAAALSFALENVPVPVVLVGAQRSSDRPSSDAKRNVLGAAQFIVKGCLPGVFVAMHENSGDDSIQVIHGCHARKLHSSRRDAFRSVNRPLVCRVHKSGALDWIDAPKAAEGKFAVRGFDEKLKVGLLKVHPQMFCQEFDAFGSFDGLVIEGTGLGHVPINELDAATKEHARIAKSVRALAKKMPVVMATQAVYGSVNMNVYSSGRYAQGLGVAGNYSTMTAECAFVKLAWLLSNYDLKKVRELLLHDLRGELVERERYA